MKPQTQTKPEPAKAEYNEICTIKTENEAEGMMRVSSTDPGSWSGIARCVVCSQDKDGHPNYRVVHLDIKDGILTQILEGERHASFEIQDRLDMANRISVLSLNFNYKDGKVWTK